MERVTFKLDVQLNDNGDFIPEGTVVNVSKRVHQRNGFVGVVITKAISYEGNPIVYTPHVSWFSESVFKEFTLC